MKALSEYLNERSEIITDPNRLEDEFFNCPALINQLRLRLETLPTKSYTIIEREKENWNYDNYCDLGYSLEVEWGEDLVVTHNINRVFLDEENEIKIEVVEDIWSTIGEQRIDDEFVLYSIEGFKDKYYKEDEFDDLSSRLLLIIEECDGVIFNKYAIE